ncbi:hypothetical protein GE061_013729 [Apolygus lucorum]|uniref:Uncharacterized protein n=1 Tax=Apolygus lucorum TaxID=248454 RepID=A0A8S9XNI3_APOLU|nr:hypothetical protein GE061_013729 [Apolygus lucorum]
MKFSVVAILVALCSVAFAAEEPVRSKRQLLAPYVATPYVAAAPYASYVASPYASYVASPYNGGYYSTSSVYAPTYASAYAYPYAYL